MAFCARTSLAAALVFVALTIPASASDSLKPRSRTDLSPASVEFHRWVREQEHFFNLHPELKEDSNSGWRHFQQFRWFHEQRMIDGELPPPGARWLAVEEKKRLGSMLRSLSPTWTSIGPQTAMSISGNAIAGRMLGIAFHPTNPGIVYVASAGGGVWKSTDGGTNWVPKTDTEAVLAVGGIAVSASVVVIGTGEGTNQTPDRIAGVGILRSTNGRGHMVPYESYL